MKTREKEMYDALVMAIPALVEVTRYDMDAVRVLAAARKAIHRQKEHQDYEDRQTGNVSMKKTELNSEFDKLLLDSGIIALNKRINELLSEFNKNMISLNNRISEIEFKINER
jgi:hypothetical protein